jgi:hypothetical protein
MIPFPVPAPTESKLTEENLPRIGYRMEWCRAVLYMAVIQLMV